MIYLNHGATFILDDLVVEGKQQQRYNGDGDDNNGRYLWQAEMSR